MRLHVSSRPALAVGRRRRVAYDRRCCRASAVLLAVALLFLVALLRSHAEILRRLAALESAWDAGVAAGWEPWPRPSLAARPCGARLARRPTSAGQTLAGDALKVSLGQGAPDTLLAFMGTGCHACAPLWDALRDERVPTPAGARLVVVTKGPERERLARLLEIAPADAEVVMSTAAWSDFASPQHAPLRTGTRRPDRRTRVGDQLGADRRLPERRRRRRPHTGGSRRARTPTAARPVPSARSLTRVSALSTRVCTHRGSPPRGPVPPPPVARARVRPAPTGRCRTLTELGWIGVGAIVAILGAVRAAFSPCGQSMLASLTPYAEAARGSRWTITAASLLGGCRAGGSVRRADLGRPRIATAGGHVASDRGRGGAPVALVIDATPLRNACP